MKNAVYPFELQTIISQTFAHIGACRFAVLITIKERIYIAARRMFYNKQLLLSLLEHLVSPPFFGEVCVTYLFSFFVLCFCFACHRCVSCVQCCPCLWIVHSWFPLLFSHWCTPHIVWLSYTRIKYNAILLTYLLPGTHNELSGTYSELPGTHNELHEHITNSGPSWSISNGSWNCTYLWNQCLSPLKLWARILLMATCTRYICMW